MRRDNKPLLSTIFIIQCEFNIMYAYVCYLCCFFFLLLLFFLLFCIMNAVVSLFSFQSTGGFILTIFEANVMPSEGLYLSVYFLFTFFQTCSHSSSWLVVTKMRIRVCVFRELLCVFFSFDVMLFSASAKIYVCVYC